MKKNIFNSSYDETRISRVPSTNALIVFTLFALLSSCISSPSILIPRPTSTLGSIYYVDGNLGSDSNAGLQARPWRTIQKAANTAVEGDIVKVSAGDYAERVQIARAGVTFEGDGLVTMQGFHITSNNIVVKGFYITDMSGTGSGGYGFNISGSNCVIENNHIYYAVSGGILLTAASSDCVVKNNKMERNSQHGIDVDGTNHVIEGNEIWGSIQYHPNWIDPPSWVDADGIRFFGSGHVFRNNYIHDIHYGIPENIDPHIDCFQTWTDIGQKAASNMLFEGNHCVNQDAQSLYEIGQGFMLGAGDESGGGVNYITIRNNLIQAYRGINAPFANNLTITNNTFVGKIPKTNELGQYGVFLSGTTSDNLIQNNIFYNIIGTSCNIHDGVSNGNLFYIAPGAGYLRCSPAAGDLWDVDPEFVNPSAGDYRLQTGSPAIGTGVGGMDFGAHGPIP